VKFVFHSDTTDKTNIAKYNERLSEVKVKSNYVEPPERKKIERKNKSNNKDEKETILKEIKQISDSKFNKRAL
jgi:hypothetical protein